MPFFYNVFRKVETITESVSGIFPSKVITRAILESAHFQSNKFTVNSILSEMQNKLLWLS